MLHTKQRHQKLLEVSFVIPYWNLSRLYFLLASISSCKIICFFNWNSSRILEEFGGHLILPTSYSYTYLIGLNKHTDFETSISCTGSTIRNWQKVKTWLDQMLWQIYQKLSLSGFLSSGNLCLIHYLKLFWPHVASMASDRKGAKIQHEFSWFC